MDVLLMKGLAKAGLFCYIEDTMPTKLVRDRIRLLENREGENFKPSDFKLCPVSEYDGLLVAKLGEELAEMHSAMLDPDALAEEIGDVIEVLFTMADRYASCDRKEILRIVEQKRAVKGGFEAGVILVTK
jgi:predicted house-cleaning noncanonical NTP pyrophosphatase (MazG superfamily)